MKKFFAIAAMVVMLALTSACSVPCRLNNFVNRTERNAYRYSLRDWHRSLDRYERLVTQYVQNYTSYNTRQKRLAMRSMGRYHAMLVQAGVRESANLLYELREYAGVLQDIFTQDEWASIDFLRDVLGYRDDRIIRLRDMLRTDEWSNE